MLKAYDAFTDELLVDNHSSISGQDGIYFLRGMYKLLYARVTNDPAASTGLTWDFTYADAYDPLQ